MPAQSSIVLDDGQTTPVAHTFVPNGALANPQGKVIAEWVDRSVGQRVGYWSLVEQYSPPNGNKIEKWRFVLSRPTLETLSNNTSTGIDPAPTKAFDSTLVMEFWVHERASEAELDDLAALAIELASCTHVQNSIKNRERTW